MYERAEVSPKKLGQPIIMQHYITGASTATTGLSRVPQDAKCCCTSTRAMHAVIDLTQAIAIHFRCWHSACASPVVTSCYTGTVVARGKRLVRHP